MYWIEFERTREGSDEITIRIIDKTQDPGLEVIAEASFKESTLGICLHSHLSCTALRVEHTQRQENGETKPA